DGVAPGPAAAGLPARRRNKLAPGLAGALAQPGAGRRLFARAATQAAGGGGRGRHSAEHVYARAARRPRRSSRYWRPRRRAACRPRDPDSDDTQAVLIGGSITKV